MVEFVMISVLLILLLFAVIQVAVFFYARNIAAASAADAARYAAAAGVPAGAGKERAEQLIARSLGGRDAISCTSSREVDAASGLPMTRVRCVGKVRAILAPLDIPLTIDVSSAALQEQAP